MNHPQIYKIRLISLVLATAFLTALTASCHLLYPSCCAPTHTPYGEWLRNTEAALLLRKEIYSKYCLEKKTVPFPGYEGVMLSDEDCNCYEKQIEYYEEFIPWLQYEIAAKGENTSSYYKNWSPEFSAWYQGQYQVYCKFEYYFRDSDIILEIQNDI